MTLQWSAESVSYKPAQMPLMRQQQNIIFHTVIAGNEILPISLTASNRRIIVLVGVEKNDNFTQRILLRGLQSPIAGSFYR
jgi:hypothetical protein